MNLFTYSTLLPKLSDFFHCLFTPQLKDFVLDITTAIKGFVSYLSKSIIVLVKTKGVVF